MNNHSASQKKYEEIKAVYMLHWSHRA